MDLAVVVLLELAVGGLLAGLGLGFSGIDGSEGGATKRVIGLTKASNAPFVAAAPVLPIFLRAAPMPVVVPRAKGRFFCLWAACLTITLARKKQIIERFGERQTATATWTKACGLQYVGDLSVSMMHVCGCGSGAW